MLWVEHDNYYGPDRRRAQQNPLRFHERRQFDSAGPPPSLSSALRHLRLKVLDARGPGMGSFVERTRAIALLAQMQRQPEAAQALTHLSNSLSHNTEYDVRDDIYDDLDRVNTVLRAA